MSFGLTPNYAIDTGLDGLLPSQFLALCVDVANALDWDIRYISDAGLIAHSSKKMFKRKQEITIRIPTDIVNIRSESIGSEMMDWGRNRRNVQQFTDLLAEKRSAISPEQLTQRYDELRPQLVHPEQDILSMPPATTREKWADFFSLFKPRKGYFITPILVDINLAIYVLMVASGANLFLPGNQSLVAWGANSRYLTLDHQWWRIVTNCFVHIGIFHLLLNMYALLYIGLLLEPQLGKRRFAAAYLLTGIMASLTSLYWHPYSLSAGASGAIFGIYGVFLALLTTNLIEKTRRTALLTSIAIFVGYNLLYGTKGGVDNAAHIGGLISGMLIGYIFYPGLRKPDNPRLLYSAIGLAVLLVLVTSVIAFKKIPNDFGLYQRKMRSFTRLEKKALAVFRLNSDTPKETWLSAIRDSGIYYWNESIRVLNEANQLDVSEPLKRRTDVLIQYCNLRITSYNYFYKKIAGAVGPGEDSVAYYNSQINELMDGLKNNK